MSIRYRGRARRAIRPIFVPSVCFVVATTVGTIGPAFAQQAERAAAPGVYERLAFDAADTDGNGFVSEAELARAARSR